MEGAFDLSRKLCRRSDAALPEKINRKLILGPKRLDWSIFGPPGKARSKAVQSQAKINSNWIYSGHPCHNKRISRPS